jgi:hypothetical protein
VDLFKWIITVAIPTAGHYLYKGIATWYVRNKKEKIRKEKFERFMEGLPISVKGLLSTFGDFHTIKLNPDDETVQLATGLGVIIFVSRHFSDSTFSYRLRDDIWTYFYKDIKLKRDSMSNPSDQRAEKKDEII